MMLPRLAFRFALLGLPGIVSWPAPAVSGPPAPLPLFKPGPVRAEARPEIAVSPDPDRKAPLLYWYDGEREHRVRIDPQRVADFRVPRLAGKPSVVRPRNEAEKSADALPAGLSPVFVDPDAPGRIRALPGGVIVTLKQAPAGNDAVEREDLARRRIAAAGVRPLRPIDPDSRCWLVESPPGMPSLELANRLHRSGDFESASPNWWQPRALK